MVSTFTPLRRDNSPIGMAALDPGGVTRIE
jgi:hypothetical protein